MPATRPYYDPFCDPATLARSCGESVQHFLGVVLLPQRLAEEAGLRLEEKPLFFSRLPTTSNRGQSVLHSVKP